MSIKGICSLCNENKNLSFEHLPPKSIGNNVPVFIHNEKTFDPNSEYYKRRIKQNKGFGFYSLCETCNNFLGGTYVNDFTCFIELLKKVRNNPGKTVIKKVKPLNIIKQIYAICISINYKNGFHKELSKLVLKKNLKPKKKYKIFVTYTNRKIYRTEGFSVEFNGSTLITNLAKLEFDGICINVIDTDDSKLNTKGLDITNFQEFEFDEEKEMTLKYCS